MPAPVTTRAQVNGYRFLLRRLEHALIRADSRMIHDPMRGQMRALLVGMVIAIVIAGAAGVVAFIKPAPNFGDSTIMLSKANGTMFVRIGDRLHPVLNLASARLVAGKPDAPKQVDDKFLNTVPLGPVVGIVGAPNSIHAPDDSGMSAWTVCDSPRSPLAAGQSGAVGLQTTVLANDPVFGDDTAPASPEEMILTRVGGTAFLVFDGVRAVIDPDDPVVSRALGLSGNEFREVSPGLLNALPLVEPIAPVQIPGVGEQVSYLPTPYQVGSILETVDSRGRQLYVVLREGLQPVPVTAADIIRYGSSTVGAPQSISPALVSSAPIVDALSLAHYPSASPRLVGTDEAPVMCLSWQREDTAATATGRLVVGHRLPIPDGGQPVPLATSDGSGPGLDAAYLKPGTGEFVRSTGGTPDSDAGGPLFYVSDLGVRYPVRDAPTAAALGLGAPRGGADDGTAPRAQPAPWPILSLIPPGPALSQQAALLAHDGMAADPRSQPVAPPKN